MEKTTNKLNVAVICGSQSPEHEVSVITARIVLEGIDREKYHAFPVYITKEGEWYAPLENDAQTAQAKFRDERMADFKGDAASLAEWTKVILPPDPKIQQFLFERDGSWEKVRPKLDVVFPALHGPFGEDGTIQGIFEFADIPYVGSGVAASGLGMDKVFMKKVFAAHDFPTPNYVWFLRDEWNTQKDELKRTIKKTIHYPVFVKPANAGSSIGVSKVSTEDGLDFAVELAATFDRKIIVEKGLVNGIIEVNCAVLGNDNPIPSLCYQPVVTGEFQDYTTKYLKGSGTIKDTGKASLKIPAPISERLTKRIQGTAVAVFKAFDLSGMARIDFLVDPRRERFWIEEPNTLPGTIAVGVWNASGINPTDLITKLIELALERYQDKKKNLRSFDSPLLSRTQPLHKK